MEDEAGKWIEQGPVATLGPPLYASLKKEKMYFQDGSALEQLNIGANCPIRSEENIIVREGLYNWVIRKKEYPDGGGIPIIKYREYLPRIGDPDTGKLGAPSRYVSGEANLSKKNTGTLWYIAKIWAASDDQSTTPETTRWRLAQYDDPGMKIVMRPKGWHKRADGSEIEWTNKETDERYVIERIKATDKNDPRLHDHWRVKVYKTGGLWAICVLAKPILLSAEEDEEAIFNASVIPTGAPNRRPESTERQPLQELEPDKPDSPFESGSIKESLHDEMSFEIKRWQMTIEGVAQEVVVITFKEINSKRRAEVSYDYTPKDKVLFAQNIKMQNRGKWEDLHAIVFSMRPGHLLNRIQTDAAWIASIGNATKIQENVYTMLVSVLRHVLPIHHKNKCHGGIDVNSIYYEYNRYICWILRNDMVVRRTREGYKIVNYFQPTARVAPWFVGTKNIHYLQRNDMWVIGHIFRDLIGYTDNILGMETEDYATTHRRIQNALGIMRSSVSSRALQTEDMLNKKIARFMGEIDGATDIQIQLRDSYTARTNDFLRHLTHPELKTLFSILLHFKYDAENQDTLTKLVFPEWYTTTVGTERGTSFKYGDLVMKPNDARVFDTSLVRQLSLGKEDTYIGIAKAGTGTILYEAGKADKKSHIFSVTKSLTGTIAAIFQMQFKETDPRFDVHDLAVDYVIKSPEEEGYNLGDMKLRVNPISLVLCNVTVNHLLTHTSGVQTEPIGAADMWRLTKHADLQKWVAEKVTKLRTLPRTKQAEFLYDNVMCQAGGIAVETQAKRIFANPKWTLRDFGVDTILRFDGNAGIKWPISDNDMDIYVSTFAFGGAKMSGRQMLQFGVHLLENYYETLQFIYDWEAASHIPPDYSPYRKNWRYAFFWWIPDQESFNKEKLLCAIGLYGQYVVLNLTRKVAMVRQHIISVDDAANMILRTDVVDAHQSFVQDAHTVITTANL